MGGINSGDKKSVRLHLRDRSDALIRKPSGADARRTPATPLLTSRLAHGARRKHPVAVASAGDANLGVEDVGPPTFEQAVRVKGLRW